MAEEADIIRWILSGIPTHEIFTRRETVLNGFPCLFEKTEEGQAHRLSRLRRITRHQENTYCQPATANILQKKH